ncbi:MAG: hypothetical protein RL065_1100 [Bacteroidota bacterium]
MILALAFISKLYAQDEADVLRYSNLQSGGTARSFSLAGATGALGGDFSNASNNPSGLAFYKSSEFTFSPLINSSRTDASYFSIENMDRSTRFGLGNIGIVLKNNYTIKGKDVTKGWTGITFAFGMNKLASFANATTYSGYNKFNSIGDKYAADLSLKGVGPNDALGAETWGSGLAFDAYLLDATLADSTKYLAINGGGKVTQTLSRIVKGAMNEMTFSFAGNYEHKLLIGGTLGIPFASYSSETSYTETDDSSKHYGFKNYSSVTSIAANGTGINLKLGATYLANDYFRLGVAMHTPTFFNFTDNGTLTMTTVRTDSLFPGTYTSDVTNDIKYSVTTPWRAIGSAAFLFKKFGFITIDYELVDYSSANLRFSSKNASDIQAASSINRNIHQQFTSASNVRIGGELKLDIFAIRAGFGSYGSPFKSSTIAGYNQSRKVASIGFGIREKDYFFDLGIQKTMYNGIDLPYYSSYSTNYSATTKTSSTIVVTTIGLKF